MIIRNDRDRAAFIAKARAVDLSKHPWEFTASPWKPNRSLAQNRLSFMWYKQISDQCGEGEDEVRRTFKFVFGCPILVERDREFAEFYADLKAKFDYEQCVHSMEFVDVTKLFKVKEFARYLTRIEQFAAERGYQLTHPADLYLEAMGNHYEQQSRQQQ